MIARGLARRSAAAVVIALAASCGSPEAEASRQPPAVGPNSADSAWVTVEPATDAALIEAPAHVVVHPGSVAEIVPTFRLHVDRIAVRPGDAVEAGAVVVEGKAPELLEAAATLKAASAQAELLSARRERLAELRRQGLVEQSRVFELEVQLAEVEGQRLRAAATLRAAGESIADAARLGRGKQADVSLTAPIAGVVRSVDAVIGQVRGPEGGSLVSIVGVGPARIEARLPGPVPPGARFEMIVHGEQVIDLGDAPMATLVVPEDGTTLAWWDPPADRVGLAPGLRGRVRARVVDPDLHRIPASALRIVEGEATVLRASDQGEPEVVPVEVVASPGTTAIVRGLLRPGDRVASDVSLVLPPPEVGT